MGRWATPTCGRDTTSQTGRFLSKDPFPGLLTNPASQHYYGYAGNSPVNWTDPSGEIAPLVVVAAIWVAYEIGSSAYDAYTTGQTLLHPCASIEEKAITSGLFVAGLALPGGGYTAGPKFVAQLERQLSKDGPRSILRSLRSLEQQLAEHVEKLPSLKYRSSVEREIQTLERQIETIRQFIIDRGIE